MTTLPPEPSFDLAHLAHAELLTPKPGASLEFFVNIMGMTVSATRGESVYLRGWDDYEHHTLKLTGSSSSGLGHYAFRTSSAQALERRVARIEASGRGIGWTDDELGHGPSYRFHDPDGHVLEVYFETEWYQATPETRPSLKNQASRFPGRGANLRRLDHINLLSSDVKADREFMQDVLGCRLTEQIVFEGGIEKGAWLTVSNKSYDVAMTQDHYGAKGRFHHLTYAVDSREDVLKAADICLEHGVHIETGPHKHAIQQTFFLYVYEPGGNRFEICNAGARLILAPDWKPISWNETEREKGQAWGLQTIPSFHTHGTPPVESPEDH